VRGAFVRGILLLLPLAITFLVLRWLFRAVTVMSGPGAARLLEKAGVPPGPLFVLLTAVFALAITLGLVLLVGLVGGNYFGKRAWGYFEQILMRVPLVRWFYGSSRQIMDAFASPAGGAFREVVVVEYPRRGIWTLGFVTAPAAGILPERAGDDWLCVFLPTTPNPTGGYMVIVPRSETIATNLTVDEGLKMILSGGFISPRGGGALRGASRGEEVARR
jgi:uncharacterized membrane protein